MFYHILGLIIFVCFGISSIIESDFLRKNVAFLLGLSFFLACGWLGLTTDLYGTNKEKKKNV